MELNWKISKFNELNVDSLYKILALRSEVFVVEQRIIYQDVDDKDRLALHLCGYDGNVLVTYSRLFRAGDYLEEACIGRVVVAPTYRRFGLGNQLVQSAIEAIHKYFGAERILISAQLYLKRFYESHGFETVGTEYLEDGIPHIRMKRE